MRGRLKGNPRANEVIEKALMCKIFRCRPSELEDEDYEDIVLFQVVYGELIKKNPMAVFM